MRYSKELLPQIDFCGGILLLLTSNEHSTNRKDLLSISVGTHIAKAHTGQTAQGEIQRGDVGTAN